jgi:uncharacterized protein YndB with AHSA1/START domain
MLKKILIGLGAVIAILALIPLVLPKHITVFRTVEINKPAAQVHAYMADFNQFTQWSPFQEMDPTSKGQVVGKGVGSTFSWQGEKTGDGKLTITALVPAKQISLALEFYTPQAAVATCEWITEAVDAGKTNVTWSMDEDLPYASRYFGLFMDGMMGDMFKKGLENVKKQLEN